MPDQLQIDFTPRHGSCAPDCGHCTDPCPWGDMEDDDRNFGEWFALLPAVCQKLNDKKEVAA